MPNNEDLGGPIPVEPDGSFDDFAPEYNHEHIMPTDLAVSEINLNNIVEQPSSDQQIDSINYEDTVIVAPQEPNDDIVTLAIKDDELPDSILKNIMLGMAEEAHAIKTYRRIKSKEGKDPSQFSVRASTILKQVAETALQNQALKGGTTDLDLKGPKFREIIKMFLGIITDTFDEVKIPQEFKDMFFRALQKNLEGWETRAEKVIKKMPGIINPKY